jgi:hypothetical protein
MGGLPAEAQCKQPLSQAKVQRHGTMYNGPFLSKFYPQLKRKLFQNRYLTVPNKINLHHNAMAT